MIGCRQIPLGLVALMLALSSSGSAFGAGHAPPRSTASASGVAHAGNTKASIHQPISLVRFNDLAGYQVTQSDTRAALVGELLGDPGELPDTLSPQPASPPLDTLASSPSPDTSRGSEPRLVPGARVRISSPSSGHARVVGRVRALLGDTLQLELADSPHLSMPVLLDDRSTVELSVAHHSYLGRGILLGGLAGALIGGLIVAGQQLSNDIGETIVGGFGLPPPHHEVSSAPFFIGVTAGGLLGGLIGGNMTKDKWVRVSHNRVSLGGSYDHSGCFRLVASVSLLPATVPGPVRAGSEGAAPSRP